MLLSTYQRYRAWSFLGKFSKRAAGRAATLLAQLYRQDAERALVRLSSMPLFTRPVPIPKGTSTQQLFRFDPNEGAPK